MGLFGIFAVVTQLQFSRISDEKIHQARLDTFQSDERSYDSAIQAHNSCLNSIEIRATYRELFTNIDTLFKASASIPSQLLPNSASAGQYKEELLVRINQYLTEPVNDKLQPLLVEDCPPFPKVKPVKPKR